MKQADLNCFQKMVLVLWWSYVHTALIRFNKPHIRIVFYGTAANSAEQDQMSQNVVSVPVLHRLLTECTLKFE